MPSRRLLPMSLIALALVPAACGSEEEEEKAASGAAAPAATATPAPEAADDASLRDTDRKPEIPKPSGEPAAELVTEDIVRGKGRRAKAGDTVTVHYVGVSHSSGEEFDASWDRGEPFTFELGAGQVIRGWDEGVAGMRKGGRRKLVIPPDMGYGPAGSPPAIGPNETLIFVVDLLKAG